MESNKPLSGFFKAIRTDARICIAHIGLYTVLLQSWQEQQCQNPIMAFSHELMKLAKIATRTAYLKYMSDLHAGGYIRYEPSFKRNERSKIYLIDQ